MEYRTVDHLVITWQKKSDLSVCFPSLCALVLRSQVLVDYVLGKAPFIWKLSIVTTLAQNWFFWDGWVKAIIRNGRRVSDIGDHMFHGYRQSLFLWIITRDFFLFVTEVCELGSKHWQGYLKFVVLFLCSYSAMLLYLYYLQLKWMQEMKPQTFCLCYSTNKHCLLIWKLCALIETR